MWHCSSCWNCLVPGVSVGVAWNGRQWWPLVATGGVKCPGERSGVSGDRSAARGPWAIRVWRVARPLMTPAEPRSRSARARNSIQLAERRARQRHERETAEFPPRCVLPLCPPSSNSLAYKWPPRPVPFSAAPLPCRPGALLFFFTRPCPNSPFLSRSDLTNTRNTRNTDTQILPFSPSASPQLRSRTPQSPQSPRPPQSPRDFHDSHSLTHSQRISLTRLLYNCIKINWHLIN